jgi:hypothetical protein
MLLDLSSVSTAEDLVLDFWSKMNWSGTYDRHELELHASGDGTNWTSFSVISQPSDNNYVHYVYDLDAAFESANITADEEVYVRFLWDEEHAHSTEPYYYSLALDNVRVGQHDAMGAAVVSQTPSAEVAGPLSTIDITFSEPIDAATLTADEITLLDPTGAIVPLDATTPVTNSGDDTTFTLQLAAPQTLAGLYRLSVSADVEDAAGNRMNQNQDRANGDGYAGTFTLAAPAITPPYFEDFEDKTLVDLTGWSFVTTGSSRIEILAGNTPYAAGESHLVFGQTAGYQRPSATMLLDLSSVSTAEDLVLDFLSKMNWSKPRLVSLNPLVSPASRVILST